MKDMLCFQPLLVAGENGRSCEAEGVLNHSAQGGLGPVPNNYTPSYTKNKNKKRQTATVELQI